MNLLQRIAAGIRRFAPQAKPKPAGETPPGGFSFGTSWFGGPNWIDRFKSRRAPSALQLVENYAALIYALVARKRDAVAKVPLRLYVDGSRAQGGKPRSACDPIRVGRSVALGHAARGLVSTAAVDQVYEVRNHRAIDCLDRPDPYGYFNREKLIGLMAAYQDVVGSGFLVPDGRGWDWRTAAIGPGPPDHLWVIYPQYVVPSRNAGSPLVDYWQYFRDRLPFESVVWFRQSISLKDAWAGAYSPAYAGEMYADQEGKFIAVFDQVLGMGPRPSMIATAKDPMMPPTDEQAKRLEQDLRRKHSAGGAGGILINPGAYEFTPTSYPPADLAGKELAEYDRAMLCSIFGVPPTYFTTETNLANLEAADEYFARFGVEPMCKSIAATLTSLVRRWDPRLYWAFDPVIAEDELQRAQVDQIYVDMGAITINQLNEEKMYPKAPWGDEPLFDKGKVPYSLLIKQLEQGLEQGRAGIEQTRAGIESQAKRDEFELSDPVDQENADEERALVARAEKLIGEIRRRGAA